MTRVLFQDQSGLPSLIERMFAVWGERQPRAHVFWAGNGGCAAMADHMAAELLTGFGGRSARVPSTSLTGTSALATAIANDFGFKRLFAAQLEVLGSPGDLCIAMSTSGRSLNIVELLDEARRRGATTVAIVGADAPEMIADLMIGVHGADVARQQDLMQVLCHGICAAITGLRTSA